MRILQDGSNDYVTGKVKAFLSCWSGCTDYQKATSDLADAFESCAA